MEEPASFKSPQEEIAFLRKVLEDKQQELDEADRNFADFQQFSKQLEDEMEQELQASEKKFADLESKYKRLKDEYERLVDKSSKQSKEQSLLISTLQEELNKVTQQRNSMQKDLRRLEQENDGLEQRERMLSTSVADLQERLEKVMEENVWVQTELDEHNAQANESAQRLRDEIRDLKLEIAIMEKKGKPEASPGKRDALFIPEGKRMRSGSNAAPPAAMSMVSDMLNLVKELEVRIASYKSNRSLLTPPTSPRYTVADGQNDAGKGVRIKFSDTPPAKLTTHGNNNNSNSKQSKPPTNLLQSSSVSESDCEPDTSSVHSTDAAPHKKSAIATK